MFVKALNLRICLFIFGLLLLNPVFSQIRIVSPYSRYGIGDLVDNNNAWNMTMGQLGIGIQSQRHINTTNPASYGAFDSLAFLFEGGFNGEIVTLSSDFQKETRNYSSLGYLLFGMPVNYWWKTSLGLIPYSAVGYNIANIEEYPGTGTVVRMYAGSGGISRLYWGNALRFFKKLSVGVNASYLFGSMIRDAKVLFPDSIYAMNMQESFYVTMNDIHFEFGAQYKTKISKDISLTLGAIYSPMLKMNAKSDILATTFLLSSSSVQSQRDTLYNAENAKGKISIPMELGGGFSFEQKDKWLVGVDYKWQNWENFEVYGIRDSLVNSWQVSAGGEIIPNMESFSHYFARVHYRLGFNYAKTYLNLRGQQLNEYGVSFGFGFPLRGLKTMVNLGFQFGGRGTTESRLIKESYFKMVVGFSIYERWFVKRKYF